MTNCAKRTSGTPRFSEENRPTRAVDAEDRIPPGNSEPPPDEPSDLDVAPDESSDQSEIEFENALFADEDDSRWEAFILDDDERDPEPEQGDFWIGDDRDFESPLEM